MGGNRLLEQLGVLNAIDPAWQYHLVLFEDGSGSVIANIDYGRWHRTVANFDDEDELRVCLDALILETKEELSTKDVQLQHRNARS